MTELKFKRASTVLGIIGGALTTCVSFVFYFIVLGGAFGSVDVALAIGVLIGGLMGGILAIIISCFAKYSRLVVPIVQLVASAAVLVVTILVVISASNSGSVNVMYILPFFVVPVALILTAGIMGLIPAEKEKQEPQK